MANWVRLWEDMPTDPKWREEDAAAFARSIGGEEVRVVPAQGGAHA